MGTKRNFEEFNRSKLTSLAHSI